jgi:hypothetical protein
MPCTYAQASLYATLTFLNWLQVLGAIFTLDSQRIHGAISLRGVAQATQPNNPRTVPGFVRLEASADVRRARGVWMNCSVSSVPVCYDVVSFQIRTESSAFLNLVAGVRDTRTMYSSTSSSSSRPLKLYSRTPRSLRRPSWVVHRCHLLIVTKFKKGDSSVLAGTEMARSCPRSVCRFNFRAPPIELSETCFFSFAPWLHRYDRISVVGFIAKIYRGHSTETHRT